MEADSCQNEADGSRSAIGRLPRSKARIVDILRYENELAGHFVRHH